MKKRILSFIASFAVLSSALLLTACGHDHTFATEWSKDATHHWHAATCEHTEEKSDYAEHVDENNDGVCDVCQHGTVAIIGETAYSSLEAAIAAAGTDATVTLFTDIDLATAISINKKVTINLNGKTLTVKNDTAGDGVFMVVAGGDLTINGNGVVNGVGNNPWNIVIYANGGHVTINGGVYTNVGATDTTTGDADHFDVIYAKNGGTVTINGGTFKGQTPNWLLNIYDEHRATSSIEVKGGVFEGFNPANNAAEGAGTNFVAEGYTVQENNNVYTVVAE